MTSLVSFGLNGGNVLDTRANILRSVLLEKADGMVNKGVKGKCANSAEVLTENTSKHNAHINGSVTD
jgi:hypothetical protein